MSQTCNDYRDDAASDAKNTVNNFEGEILEQLLNKGKASDNLNNDYDGGDAWHHENHVDKWYSLSEAAAILNQLDEFEESDSGLWQGCDMKTALSTCAAFTYGNAVYSEWTDLIKQINDKAEIILDEFNDQALDLEADIDDLNGRAEDLDNEASDADATGDDDNAARLRAEADAKGNEAEAKQAELDDLDNKKKEALREMIAEITA